jgi:hypothetical protein
VTKPDMSNDLYFGDTLLGQVEVSVLTYYWLFMLLSGMRIDRNTGIHWLIVVPFEKAEMSDKTRYG